MSWFLVHIVYVCLCLYIYLCKFSTLPPQVDNCICSYISYDLQFIIFFLQRIQPGWWFYLCHAWSRQQDSTSISTCWTRIFHCTRSEVSKFYSGPLNLWWWIGICQNSFLLLLYVFSTFSSLHCNRKLKHDKFAQAY